MTTVDETTVDNHDEIVNANEESQPQALLLSGVHCVAQHARI